MSFKETNTNGQQGTEKQHKHSGVTPPGSQGKNKKQKKQNTQTNPHMPDSDIW